MNRKPIFDAVRAMMAGHLKQSDVDLLDAAINQSLRGGEPVAPSGNPPASTSAKGVELIHSFEGLRLTAYPDPGTGGAPWTIGWGATTDEQGKPINPGTTWTRDRADARFLQHLRQFEEEVIRALGPAAYSTTQNQFDALVSFSYNVGIGNLLKSTLLAKHKAGDYAGAAAEFAKWNKAAGKVMNGLTRRRAAEAALYGDA